MKRWAAMVAALLLLCTGLAVSANPDTGAVPPAASDGQTQLLPEGYTAVAQNDTLEMAIDLVTGNVAVREKAGTAVWYANPPEWKQQNLSRDMAEQIRSQLILSFVDASLNEMTVNSYNGCVSKDNFEVRQIDGGVRVTYHFDEPVMRFRIPVEFTLGEDYMQAMIVYRDIEEYGTSRLTSVSLLPYFGAGHQEEDGYALVPDGSGALIRFADNTRGAQPYDRPVYGSDPSVDLLLKSTAYAQSVRMPVFGMKKGKNAFLAVIHEGEAAASIRAESDAAYSPYTAVHSAFIYHQKDLTGIRDKESNHRTVLMLHKKPVKASPCVRYYFLGQDAADYSGMARRYQRYLEEETGLTVGASQERAVTLQFFGKTARPANFLGIPYKKSVIATTLEDVAASLETLDRQGLDSTNVLLYGFEKGGFENRYAFSAGIDGALGGRKGYAALQKQMGDNPLYMVYDLTRDYGGGARLFRRNPYAKSLNKVHVMRQNPMQSTWDWDEKGASWKYVTARGLEKNGRKMADSLKKESVSGVLFHHMGSELYSDFQENQPADRQQMLEVYRAVAKQAAQAGVSLAADGGNTYMMGLAALQTEVPSQSSEQDIFSKTVPFYAMVYHGYVSLASQPINLAADPAAYLQILLETGVQPSYWLTACDSGKLNETAFDFLYNASFPKWEKEIVSAGAAYARLQQGLSHVRIQRHDCVGDLRITTYENGVVLVGNSGTRTQQWQGHSIPPGEVVRMEASAAP